MIALEEEVAQDDTEVGAMWSAEDAIDAVCGIRQHGEAYRTEEEVTSAWQYLISSGHVWILDSWFGTHAQNLIDSGQCTDPRSRRRLH